MHAAHFIDQLRMLAALADSPATDRVLDAFKSVPREGFTGPGPWKLRSLRADDLPVFETPDADPRWLYHCVLIVLDEDKGINIGDPGLWVRLLVKADIQPGSRILQVGAGVGYYTAILSQLAGPDGQVTAYEVEATLANQAATNLADYSNVTVRHGNAATDLMGSETFDFIVSFAGVTHIPAMWASRLSANAQLLVPLTGSDWWGAMILAHQTDAGYAAITLGRCGFYPCSGARNDEQAAQITALFSTAENPNNRQLRITQDRWITKVH